MIILVMEATVVASYGWKCFLLPWNIKGEKSSTKVYYVNFVEVNTMWNMWILGPWYFSWESQVCQSKCTQNILVPLSQRHASSIYVIYTTYSIRI